MNIYSTILAGIQNNLTLRKTQSEDASIVLTSAVKAPETVESQAASSAQKDQLQQIQLDDLHLEQIIIESESIGSFRENFMMCSGSGCDAAALLLPELKIIKRLSCFEEICPSVHDNTTDQREDQTFRDLMLPVSSSPASNKVFEYNHKTSFQAYEHKQKLTSPDEELRSTAKPTQEVANKDKAGEHTLSPLNQSEAPADASTGFISTFAQMAKKSDES